MNAQELLIGHLLPVAASIAVLWLVYRLLFRNSNRLHFNRFFLLTSMLLALAMPLLGLLSGMEVPQMATLKQNIFNGTMLNEVIVTPDGQPVLPEVTVTTDTQSRFSVWQVVGGIYLLGVGVMALLFLIKLGKLVALIIRSPKHKMDGCTAVFTGHEQGSFSFFRYAFFPSENVDPDILRHEISHIEHHHSWDILFAEVMMILQWFNPFIYLYKKELQSLHEYQADRDVVATGVDKKNYMMLILQQCTAVDFSGMSNNFSLILTKKRIKMITKNEKAKGLWWRLLATLPVLAILMIANTKVAAQEQQPEKKQINVEIGQFEIYDDNGFPMDLTDTIIYNEDGSYVQFKTTEAPDPISGEMRSKITATSCNADGTPNKNIKFTLNAIEKHGDTTMYTVEPFTLDADKFKLSIQTTEDNRAWSVEKSNDTIYNVVDQMPEFPGGTEAMMHYVADNVKYPEEAKDKDISGRVFISFVVEKDGSVSNVEVKRGIGGGCDEEAVRVISAMPNWKPGKKDGKPVRVNYMMPIVFKLTEGQPNSSVKKSDVGNAEMKPDKNGVYYVVEEKPQYPGGEIALMKYVADNIKYPEEAKDKNISGRVYVGFVIEKDGGIGDVKVVRSIGGGCDEEAVRVIKAMPKWTPGKVKGEPVRVSYMMPLNFKLWDGQENKGSLANTKYEGKNTGTKDGVTYTMKMTMEFESEKTGYFVMTLTSQKKNEKAQVEFEDVGLPFTYTYDGKSTGSIQPMNPDGSQLGETPTPPYGFINNKDGSILVNLYDMKDEIGVSEMVFKKVVK